jgi:23S rRNA pseudouridine1911/1915/1917 synthase
MNIPIIFEDTNILVINKPSGLVIHPFDYSTEYTLVDFLRDYSPEMFVIDNRVTLQDKRVIELGGVVHKLDRDTSGVMVMAKNVDTFNELKSQFRNHSTKKVYVALVEGVIERQMFTIDAPLGRGKKEYKQSTNPVNPRGELREAITDVKVLERRDQTTLVELSPKTGRTHQLRAHMASIGHPIVGDKAYGSVIESERIMLHAQSLGFTLLGEEYFFEVKEGFK